MIYVLDNFAFLESAFFFNSSSKRPLFCVFLNNFNIIIFSHKFHKILIFCFNFFIFTVCLSWEVWIFSFVFYFWEIVATFINIFNAIWNSCIKSIFGFSFLVSCVFWWMRMKEVFSVTWSRYEDCYKKAGGDDRFVSLWNINVIHLCQNFYRKWLKYLQSKDV